MRLAILATLATASVASAQQHANGATIFGNMVNTVPPPRGVAVPNSGVRGGYRVPPPVGHPHHGHAVIVPYPVYYTGGFYTGYAAPPAYYAADQGYNGDAGYDPQQSPVVIINQNFKPDTVNPVMKDYSNTPLPEPSKRFDATTTPDSGEPALKDDEPTIFLIAMRDGTILPAIAYWLDGDTLNYVTRDSKQNRISIGLVDRDFSKQLNDSRHVDFKLPPAK